MAECPGPLSDQRMSRVSTLLFVLGLVGCSSSREGPSAAPASGAEAPTPKEAAVDREADIIAARITLVKACYGAYAEAGPAGPAPMAGAPMTPGLEQALKGLDFDPMLDAQDFDGVKLLSAEAEAEGDAVVARVENFGEVRTITWVFEGTLVDDLRFADGRSLRARPPREEGPDGAP